MSVNVFSWRAILRHDVIVALTILISAPAQSKEPQVKTFLDGIYRHYLGSSVGEGKGIALTSSKIVREYFMMGLASLIIEDRAIETKYGERPVLDGDPFMGRRGWDISNLAIEVKEIGVFKAIGTVTFTDNGKPEKILVELQRSNKDWRIVDITWESGSLRDAFRRKAAYKGENLPH
ncbi:MAG TPA: DUF3828 domain-containing protein [Xanthobacteraceae bacterium]|nr:DUF3828 domain-containing protein [Xanthobacteraceae bacterium]